VARPRFQIYADAAGKYRWRLKDRDGEKIASSAESFDTKLGARQAAEIVKGTAPDADVDDPD
jgi:uncharacterized protein YegP (UPF0339 family)